MTRAGQCSVSRLRLDIAEREPAETRLARDHLHDWLAGLNDPRAQALLDRMSDPGWPTPAEVAAAERVLNPPRRQNSRLARAVKRAVMLAHAWGLPDTATGWLIRRMNLRSA